MSDRTLGRARGLNSIADPSEFRGSRGRPKPAEAPPDSRPPDSTRDDGVVDAGPGAVGDGSTTGGEPRPATPHRAVVPGVKRKRRELSIPIPVAQALAATGINPADVVMSAYRKHGDAIYAGAGGRQVSRGRERLRLSISDAEFDKISRLGEVRGWNRSETVAVLLAMELAGASTDSEPS